MTAWLESIAGPEYANALMWTIFALIGLLVLLVIIRIVRGLTFGTFVAGGKNRKTRLAVMDATAVDSQRRLVLVRRDDIEHLILIGGPTDVVVEQNIRLLPPARRPVAEDHEAVQAPPQPAATPAPVQPAAAPRSAPRPAQPAPRPQHAPPMQPAPRPATPPQAPHVSPAPAPHISASEPRFSPAAGPTNPGPLPSSPMVASIDPAAAIRTLRPVAPVSPTTVEPVAPAPAYASSTAYTQPVQQQPHAAPPQQPARQSLDEELLQELQVTLDIDDERSPADRKDSRESSLDEEMSKLLGELSVQKP